MSFITHKSKIGQKNKKKPPPRPPPPNFSKYKSKSTYNLNDNLIEWSPPSSPKTERNHNFGGSVSSSFSSSTSSLASSKKSFECDISVSTNWPTDLNASNCKISYISNVPSNQTINKFKSNIIPSNQSNSRQVTNTYQINIPSVFGPTIIRPRPPKAKVIKEQTGDSITTSLPMPSIPPPSPPKNVENEDIPYAVALYDFDAREPNDLSFQVNDIILLLRKINSDWYYGKTKDREGMFPASFIEVVIPLPDNDNIVMALYDFPAQMEGDLSLRAGQLVKLIRKINEDWLYGESNGQVGQFPSNFIDRIPNL